MILGHRYWVWIWSGILLLGLLGFFPALHWGRQTHWKNLDELLRAAGTIVVAAGILLLLFGFLVPLSYFLLFLALGAFVAAFITGRKPERKPEDPGPEP